MKDCFRRKSLADCKKEAGKGGLKKNLGALDLLLLGLGGIIGTGIFVLTGLAAAKYAGPAVTLSFLISGVACIFTALAYGELASIVPISGGAYSYTYVVLGEGPAAIVGWLMVMVCTFGAATVAAGWSGYAVGILENIGIHLPAHLVHAPAQGGVINLPAVLIALFLSLFLIRGTAETAKLNGILVFVKLAAIFLFIGAAIPHFDWANWNDFAPNGFWGIAAGAGFIFMAFTGFDTVATAAEECKNPNRDLPIGIVGSLLGAAILYIVVSGILTGIVDYTTLNNPEPIASALRAKGVHMGAKLVATGAIAGMTTVILAQIYGQSRVLFAMARDGLLPRFFTKVHKSYATPYVGLVFSGLAVVLIAGFVPVATLGQLASMSTLAVFVVVSVAVMVLRYQKPHEKRTFKCPAVYFTGSISALLCSFLLFQLMPENWLPFVSSMMIGILFYLGYGYRMSVLNKAGVK